MKNGALVSPPNIYPPWYVRSVNHVTTKRKEVDHIPWVCNLRSGSIFVSLWKLHSSGQGETKREPDTNLLGNVCRPLFWLIDICRISQSELLPLLVFLVCKFFTRGKNADWMRKSRRRVLLSAYFSRNIYHQWNRNISYHCRMIFVVLCKVSQPSR